MCRNVTRKKQRKNSSAWHVYCLRFKQIRNLNIPAISQSLRRDHVTAVSAEFCTLQFDKKLSKSRQLLSREY